MVRSVKCGLGIDEIIGDKRQAVLDLAAQHGASNVRVFGSVARGEAIDGSDIDFLVQPNPDWTLLDHIGFKQALEALLGNPVDVVSDHTLHPRIRERVLYEAVWL